MQQRRRIRRDGETLHGGTLSADHFAEVPLREGVGAAFAEATSAQAFAERMRPHIAAARAASATTVRQIADYLNAADVEARRGGAWDASAVHRVLKRLQNAEGPA